MANFEAFCRVISSSINLLFLKSDYPSPKANIELLLESPPVLPATCTNIDLYSSHNTIMTTAENTISAIITQELTMNSGYFFG